MTAVAESLWSGKRPGLTDLVLTDMNLTGLGHWVHDFEGHLSFLSASWLEQLKVSSALPFVPTTMCHPK